MSLELNLKLIREIKVLSNHGHPCKVGDTAKYYKKDGAKDGTIEFTNGHRITTRMLETFTGKSVPDFFIKVDHDGSE